MANEANVLDPEEINSLNLENLEKITASVRKRSVYEDWIDNLSFDVNTKNIMKQVLDFTVIAGNKIYQVGKAVIELAMSLYEKFPHTFDLMILAAMLSLLINSIPVIGPLLGSVAGPILILAAGAIGLAMDMDEVIKEHVKEWFTIVRGKEA